METITIDRIATFNEIVELILNKLYSDFPHAGSVVITDYITDETEYPLDEYRNPITISTERKRVIDINREKQHLFNATLHWLISNEFILETNLSHTLTVKGLKALNAVPDSVANI